MPPFHDAGHGLQGAEHLVLGGFQHNHDYLSPLVLRGLLPGFEAFVHHALGQDQRARDAARILTQILLNSGRPAPDLNL